MATRRNRIQYLPSRGRGVRYLGVSSRRRKSARGRLRRKFERIRSAARGFRMTICQVPLRRRQFLILRLCRRWFPLHYPYRPSSCYKFHPSIGCASPLRPLGWTGHAIGGRRIIGFTNCADDGALAGRTRRKRRRGDLPRWTLWNRSVQHPRVMRWILRKQSLGNANGRPRRA